MAGNSFAVWAPNAPSVRVVSEFIQWDGACTPCGRSGRPVSGSFSSRAPGRERATSGAGHLTLKADPVAFAAQKPPSTDSIITDSAHAWGDGDWLAGRDNSAWLDQPISVYELHLGSWRRVPEEDERPLSYRELADSCPPTWPSWASPTSS